MREVWKFKIPMEAVASIEVPEGAQIIHVDCQAREAFLWAVVNPNAPLRTRCFRVAGTGRKIRDDHALDHVGTVKIEGGQLMFHVFEIAPS